MVIYRGGISGTNFVQQCEIFNISCSDKGNVYFSIADETALLATIEIFDLSGILRDKLYLENPNEPYLYS